MHFIKKTLVISVLSLFGIVLLQSSASAQVFELKKELSFGDKGLEVSLLQEFLKDQGFFKEEVTGYFGPLTQEAVIRYQIENDFETVDGVFALEVKSAEVTNLSNSLNIESEDPTEAPTLKIKKVKGLKGAYKPGEDIEYVVTATKSLKNKKTLAIPEEGYHIQARVMDSRGNQISGVNTQYNADKKVWEVAIVPINVEGKYNVITSLYCGDISKDCGLFDEEVEQFDLERKINIRGKAIATTTTPVATSTKATYKLKIENLKQSNAAHNITWTGTIASDPVLQIKCDSRQVLYSTEDRKNVECPKLKWNTIAQYENQTSNVFTLASKTGEYAKVSVRIGIEGKPKSFDEKVFVMPANRSLQTTTNQNESEDDASDVNEDEQEEDDNTSTPTPPTTPVSTTNTTNSTGISDSTHKCFARQSVRTPWIPVKCDSKGYVNSAKINQMTILRKTNE